MIVAQNLTKWFGSHLAVDAIDFEIPKGQVVGFLGPNGAGKTTTIRMLTGFLAPTAGEVTIAGHAVRGKAMHARRCIGYLPESAPLYAEMRVSEYLRFRARLFGVPRAQQKTAIEWSIRRCRLEEVARRPIQHLSKGYRQRVGLAAALLHKPPVLILDEPTVGLDPAQIREVRQLIRELAGEQTILLSTHILPEVEQTCDRAMLIARGRLLAQGTIEELQNVAARQGSYIIETNARLAQSAIAAMPEVAEVQTRPLNGEWRRLSISAKSGAQDLREHLAQIVSNEGARLRELKREVPTLERLFVHVTGLGEPAGDGSEA